MPQRSAGVIIRRVLCQVRGSGVVICSPSVTVMAQSELMYVVAESIVLPINQTTIQICIVCRSMLPIKRVLIPITIHDSSSLCLCERNIIATSPHCKVDIFSSKYSIASDILYSQSICSLYLQSGWPQSGGLARSRKLLLAYPVQSCCHDPPRSSVSDQQATKSTRLDYTYLKISTISKNQTRSVQIRNQTKDKPIQDPDPTQDQPTTAYLRLLTEQHELTRLNLNCQPPYTYLYIQFDQAQKTMQSLSGHDTRIFFGQNIVPRGRCGLHGGIYKQALCRSQEMLLEFKTITKYQYAGLAIGIGSKS